MHIKDGHLLSCRALYFDRSLPTFQMSLMPPSSGQWRRQQQPLQHWQTCIKTHSATAAILTTLRNSNPKRTLASTKFTRCQYPERHHHRHHENLKSHNVMGKQLILKKNAGLKDAVDDAEHDIRIISWHRTWHKGPWDRKQIHPSHYENTIYTISQKNQDWLIWTFCNYYDH